jgi:selenocysteine lyase/cysteine desulfurase
MKEMNIDIVAFTGHKSLDPPESRFAGRTSRYDTRAAAPASAWLCAHLYEYFTGWSGTINTMGVAGLNAGPSGSITRIGKSRSRCAHDYAERRTQSLTATYCQDDLTDHIAVLLFNVNGLEAMDTGTMLDVDYSIAARTGLHCAPLVHEQLGIDKIHGGVRFGIGPFNTEEHIQKAIEAVKDIVLTARKRPARSKPKQSSVTL